MNWINLHTSTLDSPEFIGADPVQRSTWLCLLRFCTGQENGGIIEDAASWGNRKWQQLVRVTLREVRTASDLWRWVGSNLEVNFYPSAKQREVEAKREGGRSTVAKRWAEKGAQLDSSADSSAINSAIRSADTEGEGELGRIKEGEGVGSALPAKPAAASGEVPAKRVSAPKLTDAEWLSALAADPAYPGINVQREHAKAARWCTEKRKVLTRGRFLNWLNRCDKPMG